MLVSTKIKLTTFAQAKILVRSNSNQTHGGSYFSWKELFQTKKNADVGQYLDQENIQGVYKLHTIFLIGMRHVTHFDRKKTIYVTMAHTTILGFRSKD